MNCKLGCVFNARVAFNSPRIVCVSTKASQLLSSAHIHAFRCTISITKLFPICPFSPHPKCHHKFFDNISNNFTFHCFGSESHASFADWAVLVPVLWDKVFLRDVHNQNLLIVLEPKFCQIDCQGCTHGQSIALYIPCAVAMKTDITNIHVQKAFH